MKKFLSIILCVLVLAVLSACGSTLSDEESNAMSLLNSTSAVYKSEEVDAVVEDIELIKTEKAHDNEYSYFVVKTSDYDWGYAEFCNGSVNAYQVGYSESEAETRCEDMADYRLSKVGGIGQ